MNTATLKDLIDANTCADTDEPTVPIPTRLIDALRDARSTSSIPDLGDAVDAIEEHLNPQPTIEHPWGAISRNGFFHSWADPKNAEAQAGSTIVRITAAETPDGRPVKIKDGE